MVSCQNAPQLSRKPQLTNHNFSLWRQVCKSTPGYLAVFLLNLLIYAPFRIFIWPSSTPAYLITNALAAVGGYFGGPGRAFFLGRNVGFFAEIREGRR